MLQVLEHLTALHSASNALVAVYDPYDRVAYANAAFRSAFFVPDGEHPLWIDLMRRNYALGRGSRIETTDIEAWLVSTLSRRAKLAQRALESDLVDGRWLWIVETTLASGWGLFIGTDITNLRTDERSLRQARDIALRAAQTDELTGLSNRRHIMSVLEAVIARRTISQSGKGCVSVIDIDHFKRINDVYGHQVGDEVLVATGRFIRSAVRVKDAFGRVGGEEFMLVLPDLTLDEGKCVIADVLRRIRKYRPSTTHPDIAVTCSAGLTEILPGDDIRTVFARADGNLYEAKRRGRDRSVSCGTD
ncbi:GGDEF domain-containing protein [Sphingomonas sp. CFBP 13720]|uniref:GGDEF domain-containing protein n=1 Tax=Sphingomonas sp. CFBP 13720 TaxID=2775302 RepID=UPI00178661AE|nr:GGDEF domain-containing protein [Sphingomonas sp. CFBP 13720]MBD8678066.1 diguanylate cyclase [Sphingomonas sp. CFBP 13720]